ncbi:hypothetical protein MUY27_04505 [Mucilaginibacter sp. RS28]|uniref:Uncharacterized protein n=1 Tax=Mucilaginibacter straminoryzae TaxID=2932774 RepID=A0A9X1X0V2_9SPHI|nr:hypothetical protein [Mucilaginibacter straminoryzae]MCJ8208958.1 hypothetical protein [Mucilaginibacter straminoryzae]
MIHKFHIPVLGLGYSIDTPLKVARYGISSVVSIVDDELCERMREYHSIQNGLTFKAISKSAPDRRARRITAYLDLLHQLVDEQFEQLKKEEFTGESDLDRYFQLLPPDSQLRHGYELMQEFEDAGSKKIFQDILRSKMQKGDIDGNIMSKVDKMNYTATGEYTGDTNTDALAALRGFAESTLESSVVLSAGMNPKLYSYLENFPDFFPDADGKLKKKIILKVSDFRSAFIQAKFLAKKGLWVSEFRVESGLNCGGHAFATDGLLLGPILEEFKQNRGDMRTELWEMYSAALTTKGIDAKHIPQQKLSAQGGIGTSSENDFLLKYYCLDATGWGSPFLLVPEATNVDEDTLHKLSEAEKDDFYVSAASPLGVLFNNFRHSTIEEQRVKRVIEGRPGSPCTKKLLCNNTEFTEQPICTASRQYQNLKITELKDKCLPEAEYREQYKAITEKICLCEGLCASTYIKNDMLKRKESKAVAICPGPNLAYFNRIYKLDEMVKHIYGACNLLAEVNRPNLFVNELNIYIDYFRKEVTGYLQEMSNKKGKQLAKFKEELLKGINYYKNLLPALKDSVKTAGEEMQKQLLLAELHVAAVGQVIS